MRTPVPNVISWPLGGIDEQGHMSYASDDDSVREVIRNILLTQPGERLMRPEFGAGLSDFLHQPNNETTRSLMANVIKKALQQWETRILVDAVLVSPDPVNVADVHITIRYHMRHGQQPQAFTLSLSLN